VIADAQPPS